MTNQKGKLSISRVAAMICISLVVYFLLVEYRKNIITVLPYLFLLLCPLMHIFMHKNHGDHQVVENDAFNKGIEEGKRQARSELSGKK